MRPYMVLDLGSSLQYCWNMDIEVFIQKHCVTQSAVPVLSAGDQVYMFFCFFPKESIIWESNQMNQ